MLEALMGGVLIGLAAVWLYASLGRVAGISGIFAQAWRGRSPWAIAFIVGLGAGGWLASPWVTHEAMSLDPLLLGVGGVIVGVGTRLGSGCTSGHGVCGMTRFSLRSFVSVGVFMAVAGVVASLVTPMMGA